MKISRHELEKLTKILRQAYLGKESFEVGNQWQNSVMARIREIGPLNSCHVTLLTLTETEPSGCPVFHHIKKSSIETSGSTQQFALGLPVPFAPCLLDAPLSL